MKRLGRFFRLMDDLIEIVLVQTLRTLVRRPFFSMLVTALITAGCCGIRIHSIWSHTLDSSGGLTAEFVGEVIPPCAPTRADAAVEALTAESSRVIKYMARIPGLPQGGFIWGVGQDLPGAYPTPGAGAAATVVAATEELRRTLLVEFPPDLEDKGETCILQADHDYRSARECVNLLTETALSLLRVGRESEAMAVVAHTLEFSRILGRGIQSTPTLIARLVGTACTGCVDAYVGLALQRHLVPEEELEALDEIYAYALDHETSIDASVRGEFGWSIRAARLVDERLGFARYPVRLCVGRLDTAFARLQERWTVNGRLRPADADGQIRPAGPPLSGFISYLENAFTPNFNAANQRVKSRLTIRNGIRVAIALEKIRFETGEYPADASQRWSDPSSGQPFIFRQDGQKWLLYAAGTDGKYDNTKMSLNAVVWGRGEHFGR